MLGTGSPLPATTPRLATSFSKLPCRPSPPGYCRSTTNVRFPRRSTVSRCTAEQTPPVNRRWPTMRLPRPIDAATHASVSAEGRRCLNPPSLQPPAIMSASAGERHSRKPGDARPVAKDTPRLGLLALGHIEPGGGDVEFVERGAAERARGDLGDGQLEHFLQR